MVGPSARFPPGSDNVAARSYSQRRHAPACFVSVLPVRCDSAIAGASASFRCSAFWLGHGSGGCVRSGLRLFQPGLSGAGLAGLRYAVNSLLRSGYQGSLAHRNTVTVFFRGILRIAPGTRGHARDPILGTAQDGSRPSFRVARYCARSHSEALIPHFPTACDRHAGGRRKASSRSA